ncbi:MAG: hypothetical protein ACYTG0_00065 [Planctomycetota bacterium]|jgi:hypothetical protein
MATKTELEAENRDLKVEVASLHETIARLARDTSSTTDGPAAAEPAAESSGESRWRSFWKLPTKHPLVAFVVALVACGGTLFAAIDYWYSGKYDARVISLESEFKSQSARLDQEHESRLAKLENERARIRFSIENESAFLQKDKIFVAPTEIPASYEFLDRGVFAISPVHTDGHKWKWKTRSEYDILAEAVGTELNLPDALKQINLSCYESDELYTITFGDEKLHVRPRARFQFVPWEKLAEIVAGANRQNVDALSDYIGNLVKTDYRLSFLEDVLTDPEFEETQEWKDKFVEYIHADRGLLAKSLAEVYLESPGRVRAFLFLLKHKHSASLSQELNDAMLRNLKTMEAEQAKAEDTEEARGEEPLVGTPDRLAFFLGMFVFVGDQAAITPFGKFEAVEYSFSEDMFVIQGYYDISQFTTEPGPPLTRLHILHLGFLTDKGIYIAGYTIPVEKDYKYVRALMSLVSSLRIVR